MRRLTNEITKADLIESASLAATPIDFEQLKKDGILIKKTGAWWQVRDLKSLPAHVEIKVTAARRDSKGNWFVRIPVSQKKAQRLNRQLTGR